MAVKIRLRRMGMKKAPFYRVVVADGRSPRDGRFIESIGIYHPTEEPSRVEIDVDKARDWLAKGAQPSEAVINLLPIAGIPEPAATACAPRSRCSARTSDPAGRRPRALGRRAHRTPPRRRRGGRRRGAQR